MSWWMIGLGQTAFFHFILNLFFPLSKITALLAIIIPSLPLVRIYYKEQGYKTLLESLFQVKIPLIIFSPLIFFVFAKSSLPPYQFDEMAYHYLSPFDLANSVKWSFSGGIYQVIPHSLDLIYHILFALFHTYSVARLTHFALFFSSHLTLYLWLKTRYGIVPAIIYWVSIFYTPGQNWVYPSTSGYVDAGTTSFILIGIIFAFETIFWSKRQVYASIIFFSLALGSKYTPITSFLAYLFPMLILNPTSFKPHKLIKPLLLAVSVGLFWYIKNTIFTLNPIYPFVFGCRAIDCIGSKSFFGGWTTIVKISNIPSIFTDLSGGNPKILYFFIIALILASATRQIKISRLSLIIGLTTFTEVLFMKYFSGFYLRYFYHLRFILLLFIATQTSISIKGTIIWRYLRVIFICAVSFFYIRNIPRLVYYYYRYDLTAIEKDFALGRIDIFQWIKHLHPKTSQAVEWCNKQTSPVILHTGDPDLIWFDYEGMSRVFMTNCQITTVSSIEKTSGNPYYYYSIASCPPENESPFDRFSNYNQRILRSFNNSVACKGESINKVIKIIK